MKVSVTAIAAGLPIALVLAWAFKMTPEGMKRTENLSPNEQVPQWSGREFAALIVSEDVSDKSIAVLPFENRSDDKANAYFASRIQDEIMTRLAKITDLK